MAEKNTHGCSGNCSSCSSNCKGKEAGSLIEPTGEYNNIKHVIGVVSGKGGVGKSFVTSSLAVTAQTMGYQTAILDADITGPSIPKAFGVHGNPEGTADGMYPLESKLGTRIMSVNLLLEKEDQPVIWRGPVISGLIHQFWQEVVWGDVDFMFVDMPPGTGDVPLTVFQSIPVDGIVIVASPQELVGMIVEKAVKYIHKHYADNLSLTDTAKYCYVSDEHLSRKFKKETGFGFNEYLNIYRLKKADIWLRNDPKAKISEIAINCGFNDSNYFSKVYL